VPVVSLVCVLHDGGVRVLKGLFGIVAGADRSGCKNVDVLVCLSCVG
jgi:hypothetical protein